MAADAKRTECPICEKDVPVNKDGTIRAHRWRADRCHASGLTIDQARDSIRGLAEVPPPTEPERGEIVQHPAPQPEGGQLVPAAGSAIDAAVTAAMAMPGMPGMDEFLSLAMQARILSMSGAAPAHIRNHPHIAFHVAMIGRDLGISPTAAIQLIDVIGRDDDPNPQLSLSPELLNGQIRRLGLGAIRPLKRTMFECIAGAYGPDGELLGESEFDWADAVVAGLADDRCEPNKHWVPPGGNGRCRCRQGYRTYPKRMLWWRCVPTRAEALTRSGWVTRDKVWAGVEILGFDRETSELAWTEVTDVHDYEAAQTYTIENTRGSFRATATGGHDWITERWDQPGGWQKIPTDRLDSAHGHTRILASAPMRNTPSEISPIDAARLGWVITDGTISWRGKSPSITVSQSKHVDAVRDLFPMAVEDVLDTVVCPDCGSEFRPTKGPIVPRRPEHRFRLNAAESRRLLSAGGIRTKEDAAALPARLDHAGRRAMFTAMMLANGEQFCTGHEAVWDCWVILATMLGHRVSRPVRQRGSIRGRVNSSSVVSVKRLSVEPSMVEPVWCPSTGLGTWVTRIDGQVTITGNSAGFAAQDYFPEAGLGLYSPEALGAVVGPDGRPIDPTQVELPDGYGPGPGHGNGQARGLPVDTRADGAELWALQARAWALPDEQKRMLRERREQTPALRTDGGVIPFWQLPDRGLRIAKSLLAGLESQAERGDDGWDRAEALDSVHRFCAAVLTHRMVGWLDPSLGTATENPDSVPPPPRDPEPAGDAPTATQAPLSEEERKAALVTPEIIEWIKTLPGVEVEQLLDQAKVDWAGKTDPEKRMLLALEEADARAGEP